MPPTELYLFVIDKLGFTIDQFTSRKTPYVLYKHALRQYMKFSLGLSFQSIADVEGEVFGKKPDHSTIMNSVVYVIIKPKYYNEILYICAEKDSIKETKLWNKIIDSVLQKGAGYNRNLLIEKLNKYYRIDEKPRLSTESD